MPIAGYSHTSVRFYEIRIVRRWEGLAIQVFFAQLIPSKRHLTVRNWKNVRKLTIRENFRPVNRKREILGKFENLKVYKKKQLSVTRWLVIPIQILLISNSHKIPPLQFYGLEKGPELYTSLVPSVPLDQRSGKGRAWKVSISDIRLNCVCLN